MKIAQCLVSFFVLSGVALAADDIGPAQSQEGIEPKIVPSKPGKIAPMKTKCRTNTPNCSGVVVWKNRWDRGVGCTLFLNNGAQGRINFTLPQPGDTHSLHVRSGDTDRCVWIEYAPPADNLQRYYIWVP